MLSSRPAPELATPQRGLWGFSALTELLAFGALLWLLLLAPTQLSGFWPASYDFWPQALFLLLAAAASLLLALSPESKIRFDTSAILVLAFLLWNLLSSLTSVYKHDSWLESARILGAFVPFFAVRALWKSERAVWILGAWVLGVTYATLPAFWDFLQTRNPRQFGAYSNNNMFANGLAMTLPVALVLPFLVWRQTQSRWGAALTVLPFLIAALGLILTGSKGGFLAGFVALLVSAVAIWRAKKTSIRAILSRNRAIASLLLFFVLVFSVLAGKAILPRLQQARGSEDNSTMFRVYIWRATYDMALAKPIVGFGPGSFPHVSPRFSQVPYTRHAHQSWLQIAAESGFPALLLLLGAIVLAIKKGRRYVKSRDWPQSAAMMGALAALLVHGNVDSGFSTLSIALFLAVGLGVLTAKSANDSPEDSPPRGRLNPFWLGATVLLALAGNQTQKAASGESLRAQSSELARNGGTSLALQRAQEAIDSDPTSARLWVNLGFLQESLGQNGIPTLQRATELQPMRAANWLNLARAHQRHGDATKIESFYWKALENDPFDTGIRLERAQHRLTVNHRSGVPDLRYILAQWEMPYGKYAPIDHFVNLDFARATVILVPFEKQKPELKTWISRALADCNRARAVRAQNEAMRRAVGPEAAGDENEDLEVIAAQLTQLQAKLQTQSKAKMQTSTP